MCDKMGNDLKIMHIFHIVADAFGYLDVESPLTLDTGMLSCIFHAQG